MNLEQVVKKIRSDSWWSEEMPSNYQQVISAWRAFILQGDIYGKKFLTTCICLYKNDFVFEKTSRNEKLAQFYKVLRIYLKTPKRIFNEYKEFRKVLYEFTVLGEKSVAGLAKLSDETLGRIYLNYYRKHTEFFTNSIMPESVDVYTDERLLEDLRKNVSKKFSTRELAEINVTLSTYPMLSFMEKERVDFLKLTLSKKPEFNKFYKKYHWIQNNYSNPKKLSAAYFESTYYDLIKQKSRKQITAELRSLIEKPKKLRSKQRAFLKRLNLPLEMIKIFELIRLFSRWIDERKFGALHGIYYIDSFIREVSRRKTINKDLLGYTTPEELSDILLHNRKPNLKKLSERRKQSVYLSFRKGQGYGELIFTGKKAKKIFSIFAVGKTNKVTGMVANAPLEKLRGKVQVVLNPHKEKFIPNRILVTTMTRPDFVPIMRQALAIVTDEGGITSHAAIVARELGIPCIIGTKIGTKVFKTGDLVEVDANKGIVRKIN